MVCLVVPVVLLFLSFLLLTLIFLYVLIFFHILKARWIGVFSRYCNPPFLFLIISHNFFFSFLYCSHFPAVLYPLLFFLISPPTPFSHLFHFSQPPPPPLFGPLFPYSQSHSSSSSIPFSFSPSSFSDTTSLLLLPKSCFFLLFLYFPLTFSFLNLHS